MNRKTRDSFIEHITELKVLFNKYIRHGNDVAEIMNEVFKSDIEIVDELTKEDVLKCGPERLKLLTRAIQSEFESVNKDFLQSIDSDVFKDLMNMDATFIQNFEKIRGAAAATELITAGIVGYGVFKKVAFEKVKKAGKLEKVMVRPSAGAVVGTLAFMGVAFTLDFFFSSVVGSKEACELVATNLELKLFIDNEQEKIKKATRIFKTQAKKMEEKFGKEINLQDIAWKKHQRRKSELVLN